MRFVYVLFLIGFFTLMIEFPWCVFMVSELGIYQIDFLEVYPMLFY
ncbi:hypothetical protein HNP50_000908 [Elizabethkingia anophelis]|nr:hypothetical protein [Elizabethkingia anophelis]MCW2466536.1 hypothetical protein [Elizabethkingia anophelis]MCW2470220.1 hypothetical protein [Elizabethkingia anophelis]